MPRKNKGSANADHQPYFRPDFYLNPNNQFWNTSLYTEKYKERMKKMVERLSKSNKILLNLISNA